MHHTTTMPTGRPTGCPFDPPAELAALRDEQPLRPLLYPDGHVGWLATGHAAIRAVLADPRFSSRPELAHFPLPREGFDGEMPPVPPGMFINADAPEHTRYRGLLTGRFTVRRMRLLSARVEEVTVEHLDAMERRGPSTDLVTAFAQPIPALMICELLGAPYADRDFFLEHTATFNDHEATAERQAESMAAFGGFLHDLVLAKRARPTDDLLSDLTETDLTDEELANVAFLLLGAGLDTTANMIALGTLALFTNPDQIALLRADPDRAVEELLRYLSIAHTGVRVALADVELDGHLIKAGQTVTISLEAGNRDPAKFPDPDRLDLSRHAAGHLSFGHGIHQCLGQQLARVEMRVALPALFERFPTLRPTVAPRDVPLRSDVDILGVQRLPVTWDVP
ncbi:cytochrome P450 [Umezawaea endophytica]|uniref:Cytochrome P450 n=1 Tax=Umezawaea endophytica TaxID=1654476 RepID=A0A9X3AG09_9PSEU|nr:cytochrome P450 [Umezawaea endophytica]MCS7479462.1 cytochrome P450 [Umezawaea endophytica]